MPHLKQSRLPTRFIYSTADVFIAAAFNFVITASLLRLASPIDFGFYSFWQSLLVLFISIQNIIIGDPLAIHIPRLSFSERHSAQSEVFLINIALTLIAAVTTSAIFVLFLHNTHHYSLFLPVLLYVCTSLFKEYFHIDYLSCLLAKNAFILNATYTLISTFVLLIFVVSNNFISLSMLFYSLVLGSITSIILVANISSLTCHFNRRCLRFSVYRRFFVYVRWSLIGGLATELQARAYVFIVSAISGLEALAMVNAPGVVFRPLGLILTAWSQIARRQLTDLMISKDKKAIARICLSFTISMSIFLITWCFILWICWPYIRHHLYSENYPSISVPLVLWGLIYFFQTLRIAPSVTVLAMREFDYFAKATIVGGIFSLVFSLCFTLIGSYQWSLLGVVVGEVVLLYAVITKTYFVLYLRPFV